MPRLGLVMMAMMVVLMFGTQARSDEASFQKWLAHFKSVAIKEGISADVVQAAFENVTLNEDVIAFDRKQPEKKITLERYLKNTISQRRIDIGREMLVEHRDILERIGNQYGVQPKYIVALWAIETDYGNNTGGFNLIEALSTLAFEGRRADFFKDQLLASLRIMQVEGVSADQLTGSWAGAMGQCQFMPSTYLDFAVDYDGDGKRDIWNSLPDVFASVAHYLQWLGWSDKQEWGRVVALPRGFPRAEIDSKVVRPATHWRNRGVTYSDGSLIAGNDSTQYAIYPGTEEGVYYLTTQNFQALLKWNRSRYFATAVGTLADEIGE